MSSIRKRTARGMDNSTTERESKRPRTVDLLNLSPPPSMPAASPNFIETIVLDDTDDEDNVNIFFDDRIKAENLQFASSFF